MELDKRHRFQLPIHNETDLREFVRLAWGVTFPDVQVCESHSTPWRAFADAYFARSPVSVWKGSRGFGGKSFTLAVLGLTEAVTLKANVNLLGGSGEQSRRVHEHMQALWQSPSAPRQLMGSDPSKLETRLVWGNTIQALMASQASVRGPHPQRLRLDEVDEMDLAILDAAMGQPMSGASGIATQTVMSSTHQYPDGTMTEVLKRAAAKGWPVHEWCWRETSAQPGGWLSTEEIERKRSEVTAAMWQVEYDLQEPSPQSRAIQPEAVRAMFRRELGEFRGADGECIEIEAPVAGALYSSGADWARKQDWTIMLTFRHDCKPARLVAFRRMGRRPWPVMVAAYDELVTRYPGHAADDGTGLGDVVGGYMRCQSEHVVMVGRSRADMLSNYIAAVERGEIVAPHIEYMESEHRLASVDDVYGSGHLPDSISAAALAWSGLQKRVSGQLMY
jgi:hypothetical protein